MHRILGNLGLSFITKLSAGYWDLFDPTNGYTALHAAVARRLPLEKLHRGYFFETDMLFRLSTTRAVVVDVPMDAVYGEESSNLRVSKVLGPFLFGNLGNAAKRIFYNYFLRDFSIATLELVAGIVLLAFGTVVGLDAWTTSARTGQPTLPGTVMLAGLPVLAGLQLLLAFIGFDIASVPRRPIHPALEVEAAVVQEAARSVTEHQAQPRRLCLNPDAVAARSAARAGRAVGVARRCRAHGGAPRRSWPASPCCGPCSTSAGRPCARRSSRTSRPTAQQWRLAPAWRRCARRMSTCGRPTSSPRRTSTSSPMRRRCRSARRRCASSTRRTPSITFRSPSDSSANWSASSRRAAAPSCWSRRTARFASLLYPRLFRSEGFDKAYERWDTPQSGPMHGANQALAYLVFVRDRERFERLFPQLEIVAIEPMRNGLRYLLSGGLNFRQLLPDAADGMLRAIERWLAPAARALALHQVIVLRKRSSA